MTSARKPVVLVALDAAPLATWRSIALMQSPSFRALTKSAHLCLARIEIGLARRRPHITFHDFIRFGVSRDSTAHAIAELEGLGIIRVQRQDAKANGYAMSDKWREVTSIEEARRIRDVSRAFGIFARRKRERKMAARLRGQDEQHQHGKETSQ